MKPLVTGGTGFIGSHLVDGLIHEGHEVTVLIRETSSLRWLEGKPVTLVTGDIRDEDSLTDAVKGRDVVFHVAGAIRGKKYRHYAETNEGGTHNIMKAIVRHNPGVRKVIYVSSLSAGGPTTPDHPLTEADPSRPMSAYGKTKYAGEQVVLGYGDRLNVVALRPPVVYGPRDKGVLAFFQLVSKHLKINLGYRDRYATVIHVSDLVAALILLAEHETVSGGLYYVDDGHPVRRWLELEDGMAHALGTWAVTLRIPLAPLFLAAVLSHGLQQVTGKKFRLDLSKYREISQLAWLCDGTKIRNELGFKPRVTFQQGILETAAWYREMGWIP